MSYFRCNKTGRLLDAFVRQATEYSNWLLDRIEGIDRKDTSIDFASLISEGIERHRLSVKVHGRLLFLHLQGKINLSQCIDLFGATAQIIQTMFLTPSRDYTKALQLLYDELIAVDASLADDVIMLRTGEYRESAWLDHAYWQAHIENESSEIGVQWIPETCNEGPKTGYEEPAWLSASQRASITGLDFFLHAHQNNRRVAGVAARPQPLLVGPTGSGKTFLVDYFCRSRHLGFLALNPGNWTPHGARGDNHTMCILRDLVRKSARGIIYIDEIDKFFAPRAEWSTGIIQELMALLDGRPNEAWGWTVADADRLRSGHMIVGSGTWQAEFQSAQRTRMGFLKADPEAQPVRINIDRQTSIPQEILNRFNASIIYIDPPAADEFAERIQAMHLELGIPEPSDNKLRQLGLQAAGSHKNTRWLEAYLAHILRQRYDDEKLHLPTTAHPSNVRE